MATIKTCDHCQKPDEHVNRVEVHIIEVGAVVPDQPTGSSQAIDLCPGCRVEGTQKIFAQIHTQHIRDIPRHREMIRLREEEGALTKKLEAAVKARDALPVDAPNAARLAAEAAVKALEANIAGVVDQHNKVAREPQA